VLGVGSRRHALRAPAECSLGDLVDRGGGDDERTARWALAERRRSHRSLGPSARRCDRGIKLGGRTSASARRRRSDGLVAGTGSRRPRLSQLSAKGDSTLLRQDWRALRLGPRPSGKRNVVGGPPDTPRSAPEVCPLGRMATTVLDHGTRSNLVSIGSVWTWRLLRGAANSKGRVLHGLGETEPPPRRTMPPRTKCGRSNGLAPIGALYAGGPPGLGHRDTRVTPAGVDDDTRLPQRPPSPLRSVGRRRARDQSYRISCHTARPAALWIFAASLRRRPCSEDPTASSPATGQSRSRCFALDEHGPTARSGWSAPQGPDHRRLARDRRGRGVCRTIESTARLGPPGPVRRRTGASW
jgi:hypothetical protein